jgi:hypothetical protein
MIPLPQALIVKLLGGVLATALIAFGAGVWGIAKGTRDANVKSAAVLAELRREHAEARSKLLTEALAAKTEYAAFKQHMIDALAEAYRERNDEQTRNRRTAAALSVAHDSAGGLRDTIREFARASRSGGEAGDDLKTCRERAETLGALLDDSVRVQDQIAGDAEETLADYRTLFNGWPTAVTR